MALPADARVNRAVDRDAVPGELAVRVNKVPSAGARLGSGSRRGRRSVGRDGVGGPRLHRAQDAGGGEDRCSKNAELCNGSPPASPSTRMHWKMTVARHSRRHMQCWQKNSDPSGRHTTSDITWSNRVRPRPPL